MGLRYVVTGRDGQIARALMERAVGKGIEIITLARPEFDLTRPETIGVALEKSAPDLVISAAAYTAVDQAESNEAEAALANAVAPGEIGLASRRLGIPVIHLSTDYVFNGEKATPYEETDPVAPLGVYGRTKLEGERALAAATEDHAILRTAWVYSAYGRNFLRTMLHLAESRDSLNVVADQIGNPTSAIDIADGILAIAGNLMSSRRKELRGIFHMSGRGEATWAGFAREIFRVASELGRAPTIVQEITTSEYPTPARRPNNSRLNSRKIEELHGVKLPEWQESVEFVVRDLLIGRK